MEDCYPSLVLPCPYVNKFIDTSEFSQWLEEKLVKKYYRDIDKILVSLKPSLILLKKIKTIFEEIGKMVTTENTRKKGEEQHHYSTAELKGALQYVDNSIYIIDSLAIDFPICVHSKFLADFQNKLNEVVTLLPLNLHVFNHLDLEGSLKKVIKEKVEKIESILAALPQHFDTFNTTVERFKPLLLRLDYLKETIQEPLEQNLKELNSTAEIDEQRKSEVSSALDKYNKARDAYKSCTQDKQLKKGKKLQQDCVQCFYDISQMVEPFVRISHHLKSQKWVLPEETEGLSGKEIGRVNRFTSIPEKAFVEEILTIPAQEFIYCVDSMRTIAENNLLRLSKKNQVVALQYYKKFDKKMFKEKMDFWDKTTEELQQLEANADYQKKLLDAKELAATMVAARKHFDKLQRDFQKAVTAYWAAMETWNELRCKVTKCCIAEFQEVVELRL